MTHPINSRSDPSFAQLLSGEYLDALELHPHSVYGLWPDLTLAYMNPAWFEFARCNDGSGVACEWPIGRPTIDALPPSLQPWYRALFAEGLAGTKSTFVRHEYECSSAELLRSFVMMVYPVGHSRRRGFVVVHSLRLEVPHADARRAMPAAAHTYQDEFALMRQCLRCRCIQTVADPLVWHWVPDWVRHPQLNVSHSLCNVCLEYYYPAPAAPALR